MRLAVLRDLHRDADARLADIYNSRAPWAALPAAYQQKMRNAYASIKHDAMAGVAWQRLLNHLGHKHPFLAVEPVIPYLGPQPGNTFLDALLMLALRYDEWQNERRSVASREWRKPALNSGVWHVIC